jgi:hypothetical protein
MDPVGSGSIHAFRMRAIDDDKQVGTQVETEEVLVSMSRSSA